MKLNYYSPKQLPRAIFKHCNDNEYDFIKVYDYHISDYFYCKINSGVYPWEDYKYVLDVDNGRNKFSIWYNTPRRRWQLFDNDVIDIPIKKLPQYVIADEEFDNKDDFLVKGSIGEIKEYVWNEFMTEKEFGGWKLYNQFEWQAEVDGFDSDEFVQSVIDGAGWCTENYIINHSEISKAAQLSAAKYLSQRRLLYYEHKLSAKESNSEVMPRNSKTIKLKDVEKIFK